MITISLEDRRLEENLRAMSYLQKTGLYSDEELQKLYDRQVAKDNATAEEEKA